MALWLLRLLSQVPCDVVLLDMNLPDNAAGCLLCKLTQDQAPLRVLMTGLGNSEKTILHCLEDGAAGYVLEEEPWQEFVNKICAVACDEFIISPTISTALIARIVELKQWAMQLNGFKLTTSVIQQH